MLRLRGNQTLEVLLGGAVATNELPWYVSYSESTYSEPTSGTTNGATPVTIAGPVPSLPTTFPPTFVNLMQITYISFYNADTAPVYITIRFNDGMSTYVLITTGLNEDERLEYNEATGFKVLTALGGVKGACCNGDTYADALLLGGM